MPDATVSVKEFNLVSQLGHFAGGAAIVSFPVAMWGYQALWWSLLAMLTAAALKEFVWDKYKQTVIVRGSSLEDFSFYMIGAISVAMPLYLKHVLSH